MHSVHCDPAALPPPTTGGLPPPPLATALAALETHTNTVLAEYADALVEACPGDPLAAVGLPTSEAVGRELALAVAPPSVDSREEEEVVPLVGMEQLRESARRYVRLF